MTYPLKHYELKAIGSAIRWMESCLRLLSDDPNDAAALANEREKLRVAKAAHRKLNADYKASRPKVAIPAGRT